MGAIILMIAAVGCATSRGTLDIEDIESTNPETGHAVRFVEIVDQREFQIDPPQPDIPSLKNDEIDDQAITSRAIARKRNGYGKALGDILLPEGKAVSDVVTNRLTAAFRSSGFRVLDSGSEVEQSIPLEVRIKEFWGWFSPGFWSIGLNFRTSVVVFAPVVGFEQGVAFESEVERRFQTAMESNWQTVIDQSLQELGAAMRDRIQRIGPESEESPGFVGGAR